MHVRNKPFKYFNATCRINIKRDVFVNPLGSHCPTKPFRIKGINVHDLLTLMIFESLYLWSTNVCRTRFSLLCRRFKVSSAERNMNKSRFSVFYDFKNKGDMYIRAFYKTRCIVWFRSCWNIVSKLNLAAVNFHNRKCLAMKLILYTYKFK